MRGSIISMRLDDDTLARLDRTARALNRKSVGRVTRNTIMALALQWWLDKFDADRTGSAEGPGKEEKGRRRR